MKEDLFKTYDCSFEEILNRLWVPLIKRKMSFLNNFCFH